MDYLILCFGRTEFTRMTVDSIRKNCGPQPNIVLVNNGWNARFVPEGILKVWREFVTQYRDEGKISSVLELDEPVPGSALDALSKPALSEGNYHFITDNDCIILPPGGDRLFEEIAVQAMDEHPDIWKLGAFLYRRISPGYCQKFLSEGLKLDDYVPIDWAHGERFAVTNERMQDYADVTGTPRTKHPTDPQIWMIPSDTTLSIVRNPNRVTERNRLSPTLRSTEILHIGYLESHYCSRANTASTMEFIYFHFIRPKIMLQFASDYQARGAAYLKNLKQAGHGDLIEEFKKRYLSPAR